MIAHKTFTKQTTGLTGKTSLGNREKLRAKIEKFVTDEINEEAIISITETATTVGGLFSITIWYRQPA